MNSYEQVYLNEITLLIEKARQYASTCFENNQMELENQWLLRLSQLEKHRAKIEYKIAQRQATKDDQVYSRQY